MKESELSIEIRFVALERWPGTATLAHQRKRSPFTATWSTTITLLERELQQLRAREIVIKADCDPSEVRLDGHLRADAKLRGPGVVLSFEARGRELSFPCDTYLKWQDNVRAIALTLEHLRAVNRYGVTQRDEQYTGWAKLTGPVPPAPVGMARGDALSWLQGHGIPAIGMGSDELRRAGIELFHPDRNGGADALWKQWLQVAAALGVTV